MRKRSFVWSRFALGQWKCLDVKRLAIRAGNQQVLLEEYSLNFVFQNLLSHMHYYFWSVEKKWDCHILIFIFYLFSIIFLYHISIFYSHFSQISTLVAVHLAHLTTAFGYAWVHVSSCISFRFWKEASFFISWNASMNTSLPL